MIEKVGIRRHLYLDTSRFNIRRFIYMHYILIQPRAMNCDVSV